MTIGKHRKGIVAMNDNGNDKDHVKLAIGILVFIALTFLWSADLLAAIACIIVAVILTVVYIL